MVAVGETCLDEPRRQSSHEGSVVWTSPDGIAWTQVAEPSGLDEAYWLETVDSRIVAMGWEPTDTSHPVITAFACEDGVEWTQVYRKDTGDVFNDFHGAGKRGTELLRIQCARSQEALTVWHSPDGLAWTQHSGEVAGMIGRLRSLSRIGDWWVAAGAALDDTPAAWTSPDGLHWNQVPGGEALFGTSGGIVDMIATGSHLIAVGMTFDDSENTQPPGSPLPKSPQRLGTPDSRPGPQD